MGDVCAQATAKVAELGEQLAVVEIERRRWGSRWEVAEDAVAALWTERDAIRAEVAAMKVERDREIAAVEPLERERDDYATAYHARGDTITTLRAQLATAQAAIPAMWLAPMQAENARLRAKLARPKVRGAKRNTVVRGIVG